MKPLHFLYVALLALIVPAVPVDARTLLVPDTYETIQSAIDDSNDGDTVMVAPGRYCENVDFGGRNIMLTSTNPHDPNIVADTIIDANGVASTVSFINGEGPGAVLTGFTITGGYGTVAPYIAEYIYWGAGVYCDNASPTITANLIADNHGPNNQTGDDPANWQIGYGGGIGCINSNAIISRNIIKDNTSCAGAGITVYMGQAEVSSNLIYDNAAEVGGGAVLLDGAEFANNTVASNSAVSIGNVYAASETTTCDVAVSNNIICNARSGGGVYYVTESGTADRLAYNNVWNNAGGDYQAMNNQTGANRNISQDPLFVNPTGTDYHLQPDSPCINGGDPDFIPEPNQKDIDGDPRVFAAIVDIGADEYIGYLKPVADAGPDQHLGQIELVTLDASGSFFYDPSGITEFQWAQAAGSDVVLSDSTAVRPTFMPPAEAEYLFSLTVSDGINTSEPDEVLVVVGNRAPVANAGPNTVCQIGEQVWLDGRASYDPDPYDVLSYNWTQTAGPNVTLYDADTSMPHFDCDDEGIYEFELVVSDGLDQSQPSTVQVVTVDVTLNQQNLTFDIRSYNHYGDISGSRIIYVEGSACDFTWTNECQNLQTGDVFRFDAASLDTQPNIDADIVVWAGGLEFGSPWYHEPSNLSIFARNLITGDQKTLRKYSMSKSYSHPTVSDKKVVWLEHLNLDTTPLGSSEAKNWWNTPYNVCGADITDLTNPVYFTIDVNVGTRDPYPCHSYAEDFDDVIDICANVVVWEGNGDIYGADISDLNDIKVFPICTDPARQYDPAISGNIVVWTDERNDGGDIYGADISDLNDIRLLQIVTDNGSQKEPAISGSLIVYVDVLDRLYGGYIRACCLTKRHGVLDIDIAGSPYGMGPAIDGSLIVFQDNYYGKGHGISLEVAYAIVDGPIQNLATEKRYDYVQHAINAAEEGDEIVLTPGTYCENFQFRGKNVTVRSVEPENPDIIKATIINGWAVKPVISFCNDEIPACRLSGLTITGGSCGVRCRGGYPTITNCRIVANAGPGLELLQTFGSSYIANCLIADNAGDGLATSRSRAPQLVNCIVAANNGNGVCLDRGSINNSTIVANALAGVSGNGVTVKNCIVWANLTAQMEGITPPTAAHSNIQGGWPGLGNIDADPCFVRLDAWDANGLWLEGNWRLLPASPCIDAGDNTALPADARDLDADGNTTKPIPLDFDCLPRIKDGDHDGNSVVDIGACEFFMPPIEVPMKFTPQALNLKSKGNWVKASLLLPQGLTADDVDTGAGALLEPFGITSAYMTVFADDQSGVKVVAAFDRAALCTAEGFEGTVTVQGLLTSGRLFYGTDTIKLINNSLGHLAALAARWLDQTCTNPTWCEGYDINNDGAVDFTDLALLSTCDIDIITD